MHCAAEVQISVLLCSGITRRVLPPAVAHSQCINYTMEELLLHPDVQTEKPSLLLSDNGDGDG